MGDRLRALWDFGDLDGSEARLRAALDEETTDEGRAEVLTQLARVEGLRGRFAEGDALLARAATLAPASALVRARIDLEQGRLRRSAGDVEAAFPSFVRAFAGAEEIGHAFLAADAAHMAAIAAPDRQERQSWADRGIAIAEASTDPEVASWLGPLCNNAGWDCADAGDHATALMWFERALDARLREPEKPQPIAIARFSVGTALRELGRGEEAAEQLEQAVAWADSVDAPDGWFHEELARDYALLGRATEAAEQADRALELLPRQDPSFAPDGERATRLRALAEAG